MNILIISVLALIGAISLIWFAHHEPGFVLLQYGGWQLETSLIVFAIIMLALFVVAYLAIRSLALIKQAPKKIITWHTHQLYRRNEQKLARSLIALEAGYWAKAEKMLIRHVSSSDEPLIYYLAAAKAAQKQNALDRRDNYLQLADKIAKDNDVTVGAVRAKLQLIANQQDEALTTLQHLRKIAPKQPYVLQLLQQLYTSMGTQHKIRKISHHLPNSQQELAVCEAVHQLKIASTHHDWHTVTNIWQATPRKIRHTEDMTAAYVASLIDQHNFLQAGKLIEKFLQKKWSDRLVYYYGLVNQKEPITQLATAEKWLKNRQNNPWLLLTLGRLAKANKMWGKAEKYLRASIQYGAQGETYQVLAETLATEGQDKQAIDAYQNGMNLVLSQTTVPTHDTNTNH